MKSDSRDYMTVSIKSRIKDVKALHARHPNCSVITNQNFERFDLRVYIDKFPYILKDDLVGIVYVDYSGVDYDYYSGIRKHYKRVMIHDDLLAGELHRLYIRMHHKSTTQ